VTPLGRIESYSFGTLCRVINREGQFEAIVAWDAAFIAAVPPHDIRIFPADQGIQTFPHVLPLPRRH
jgi:hypothetical protein